MKKLLFSLLFLAFTLCFKKTDAQPTYTWAKALGGSGAEVGLSIAVDFQGNVYTTGWFDGIVDFDPGIGTYTIAANHSYDIFISKLDASGNFVWARQIGGDKNDQGNSIAVDSHGNVFVTGYFRGQVDFDPGIGTFSLNTLGLQDAYILKLDSSGNFIWVKQIRSSTSSVGNSIALDAKGNIYTTGWFSANTDFDPGPNSYNLISLDWYDVYVSKLDPTGGFIWAKQIGPNATLESLALDIFGNIFVGGFFKKQEDFDPGPGTYYLTPLGNDDIFICKLDGSGNFLWAKQIGGPAQDDCFSLVADRLGNVYATGNYGDTVDFDPGPGTYYLSGTTTYINKLDRDGNFVWAKAIGGNEYNGRGISIALDLNANVYTTGCFSDKGDFDPGIGVNLITPFACDDVFISQLDSSGNFLWADHIGGTGCDVGYSIYVDDCGSIYTSGYFQYESDFDPGPDVATLPLVSAIDAFVSKLGQLPKGPISATALSNTVCCGRPVTLIVNGTWLSAASWNWYTDDCGANLAGTGSSIVVSPTTVTTYFVRAENSCYTTECASVTVNTIISPKADFETSYSVTCQGLATTYFNKSENADSYQWNFNNGSSIDPNINHNFNYNETNVTSLIAINNNGCRDTLNFENVIGSFKDYFNITPPNVFTPNNDGINDEFKINITEDIARCSNITIFDRWGKLLFTSSDQNLSWDGRTTSGSKAVSGVYFYILEINDQKYNGSFSLLD